MNTIIRLALPLSLLAVATSSFALDIPPGRYQVVPLLSNKCADVTGSTTQLIQKECVSGAAAQQFDISATSGGYYKVVSTSNSQAWTVNGSATTDGTALVRATFSGTTNQQYFFMRNGAGYVIQARHSNKCLEMKDWNTADGGLMQQSACVGGSNQTFVLKPTGTDFGSVSDGRYRVTAKHSGKCLDVQNSSLSNGVQLEQYSCNNGANQQFDITYVGGSRYEIRNVNSGKCVDLNGSNTANGANVQQYDCNRTNAQRWAIAGTTDNDGSVQFKSALDTNKVWDVVLGNLLNGADVQIYTNTGVNQQKWFIEPVIYTANVAERTYSILNVKSGKCLDVPNSSLTNGTQIQQYTCNGSNAQKFQAVYMGDGFYKLINVNSGLALHVGNYSQADNGAVQQFEEHSGDNQLFNFVVNGSGYLIKPKSSYKCLDISGGSIANNALLIQFSCNLGTSQTFKLQ